MRRSIPFREFNTAVIKWYNDFSDVLDLMFGWLKSFAVFGQAAAVVIRPSGFTV